MKYYALYLIQFIIFHIGIVTPRTSDKTSICLWCGKSTFYRRVDESAEHVIPVAIGGKKILPIGSVCRECNNQLGFLDDCLKYEHEAMMDAFQADYGIKGRIRNKDDRERKAKERIYIKGKGDAIDVKIGREGSDVHLINANFDCKSEKFVRSLHKCTANILCNTYGSELTRKSFPDLLRFVYYGGDWTPWSYAVSFSNPFQRPIISEPRPFTLSRNLEDIVGFSHSSGIWLTGSKPSLLTSRIVEEASDIISQKIRESNKTNPEMAISSFGFNYSLSKNDLVIGDLKFIWTKKNH
jgi:hypothetical protein